MLSTQKLKYVLIDWDNTLANTRPLLVKTIERVLAEYDMPNWEISKQKRDANLSFRDNFPHIFGESAEEAYSLYRKLYLEELKNLNSIAGASDVLNFFTKKQIPIIILTNKDRFLLDKEIAFLYDANIFHRIIAGHEAKRDKPYPEHAWYALNGLLRPEEINRDNVWLIGDSHQDSECAKAINALPIRIGKPIWNIEEEKDYSVRYYNDFAEFLSSIDDN